MNDPFENIRPSLESPPAGALEVTPDDNVDLATASRGFYIGGGGDLTVIMLDGGNQVTLKGINTGQILPLRVSRVMATGTTATNIVAVF